jgi:transcriptional regulator with XRE-family HTH domain
VEREDETAPPVDGDFAECLQWLLTQSKRKQAWLARKLGLTQGAITHWKQGRTVPRDATVDEIDRLLGGTERLGAGVLRQAAERSRAALPSPIPAEEPMISAAAGAADDPTQPIPLVPPGATPGRRQRRRWQWAAGVLAIVLVAAVAGAAALGWWQQGSRPPTVNALPPPPDVLLHEVWRSGTQAHVHVVDQHQWAMTRFRATEPFLRSVEVNIDGPTVVHLSVLRFRKGAAEPWQQVTRPVEVAVVPNGHTKLIYDPVIPVTRGELLYLQVYNIDKTKLAVYYSDRAEGSGQSYLWCPRAAERCVHPHSLNAIVYGWARAG